MSTEAVIVLLTGLLTATVHLAGPLLLVSLLAGLGVGVVQTATQLNEASVAFVAKVVAVLALLVVLGPALASQAVNYCRTSLLAIEHVVR